MAMMPRDIPVHRKDVVTWHTGWVRTPGGQTWEQYLRAKIDALNLPDDMVNTVGYADLPDEVHVADMVMADMFSYGYKPDGSPV